MTKLIISNKDEHACADLRVKAWTHEVMQKPIIYVATKSQFLQIQLLVKYGDLEPITFEFDGQDITINRHGQLSNWPDGLFNQVEKQQVDLSGGWCD